MYQAPNPQFTLKLLHRVEEECAKGSPTIKYQIQCFWTLDRERTEFLNPASKDWTSLNPKLIKNKTSQLQIERSAFSWTRGWHWKTLNPISRVWWPKPDRFQPSILCYHTPDWWHTFLLPATCYRYCHGSCSGPNWSLQQSACLSYNMYHCTPLRSNSSCMKDQILGACKVAYHLDNELKLQYPKLWECFILFA